ncbi:MAG TPA: FAD-binding oxidoreductase [Streptosporangiaceae bacterium]
MSRSVIVIGGGIVGCATAYFAARDGMRVTLLEREHVGYGASGRNPGFVWLHCRNPGFALDVSRAGRKLYEELLEDLPGGFEFRAKGGLIYFTTPEQGAVMSEFVAARRADGLQMELIDGAQVRKLVPPIRSDVLGASFCAEDAQINTPQVVRALAEGARREGAQVREGITVTGIEFADGRAVGVQTDQGRVDADSVVMAAGAWSRALLATAGIDLAVGGERLQVIATDPLPPQIEPLVYGPLAAKQYALFRDLPSWDSAHFSADYEDRHGVEVLQLVAQRANGEVLMGCPMDYPADLDLRPTLSGLAATARAIADDFPGLASAPVSRVWAGVLPYTTDTAPVIDEAAPGLFIASGHVFGNSAGPMTGRLITQLIAGREPEIDLSECRFGRPLGDVGSGAPARW